MAGYVEIFFVGVPGGFMGADGANRIDAQLWVGTGSREWWIARYFSPRFKRIGAVRRFVPREPDRDTSLVDACILFLPQLFVDCPSFAVRESVAAQEFVDFNANPIPDGWLALRAEARPIVRKLPLWFAELRDFELKP